MSETAPPLLMSWDGECFRPVGQRACAEADKYFVIGARYRMAEYADRSIKSHNHYFSRIAELWANLPESDADRFPTSEHLRKYALIRCGFHDSSTLVCATNAQAIMAAQWSKPIDEFSVFIAKDCVVTRYTAKSQSRKAMPGKEFQDSKTKVLEWIEDYLAVPHETPKQIIAAE